MRWCWILVALILGCAPAEDVVSGDERFTTSERAEVERGMAWLYAQTGRQAPRVEWTYRVTSSEPMPLTIRREAPPTGSTGWCTGSTVYLSPNAPHLAGLAAHEMAHCALGLADDDESAGIMHVVAEPWQWTERERTQCEQSSSCR